MAVRRYRSGLTDSDRWTGFPFRPGDIVISSPAKSGTTWLQMICALLVFQDAALPAPLTVLSPWLDMSLRSRDEAWRQLAAQRHRRFIKTHTPLDGLPAAAGVTYLTAARDPRDVAVSTLHHLANLDLGRLFPAARVRPPSDQRRWLDRWIGNDTPPDRALTSLRGLVWHLRYAWARRERDDLALVRYADLHTDLAGQVRRLADRLEVRVPAYRWDELIRAATFDAMRARAGILAPNENLPMFRDPVRFFRHGTTGHWRTVFDERLLCRYRQRVVLLAGTDLTAWLHAPLSL